MDYFLDNSFKLEIEIVATISIHSASNDLSTDFYKLLSNLSYTLYPGIIRLFGFLYWDTSKGENVHSLNLYT